MSKYLVPAKGSVEWLLTRGPDLNIGSSFSCLGSTIRYLYKPKMEQSYGMQPCLLNMRLLTSLFPQNPAVEKLFKMMSFLGILKVCNNSNILHDRFYKIFATYLNCIRNNSPNQTCLICKSYTHVVNISTTYDDCINFFIFVIREWAFKNPKSLIESK